MKNISFLNKAFSLLFILVTFSSCEEVIDLPLKGADSPALIVEAELVDVEGYSFVKLGETLDYYEPIEEPKISGAIVSITDQDGNKMNFLESKIFPVANIDSLQIRFTPKSRFQDEGYYLYFYAKEPQETKDYYFWRNYQNDTLNYENAGDLTFASDEGIGEDIDGLRFPFIYNPSDTARLEQYSTTKEVYDFYNDLTTVAFNDGGLFSPPPVNPRTNIKGGNVLGVFMTSSMVSETIYVPEE